MSRPFIISAANFKRLIGVAFFTLLLFCLLIGQFFKIQILECEKWTKKARAQHQIGVKIPFKRGLFYSNTSIKQGHPDQLQPLVIDVPKFHLHIDPSAISDKCKGEMIREISLLLKMTKQQQEKMKLQFLKKKKAVKLAKWLDPGVKDTMQKWWLPYAKKEKIARNALYFVEDYQRSYPFGSLLGQVLHTVREDKEEKTEQGIPTGGLELIFNQHLKGKMGKSLYFRSPRHSMESGTILKCPEDGADVFLTVNHCIQAIAEEEIEKAVKTAKAKGGWAVMMEPRTGEILALAQYPFFHPSNYRQFFNDSKQLEDTKVKAVTDPYEPGSIIKPLILTIGLMANEELKKQGKKPIFSPTEKIATLPSYFPGRKKPIKDIKTHTCLNMYMGLQKSSNVYMAKIMHRVIEALGEDWLRGVLQNIFRFGLKTNIELPSESAGLLPLPGKLNPNGTMQWSKPTPYVMAMGHNILANSIQMIRNFAIIANGGYDVQPTLVKKIVRSSRDGTKEVILDHCSGERLNSFKRILEPGVVEEMVKTLKFTTKTGGSATRADIEGYTEAGKTGTSEKIVNGTYSKKDHISTFVGFAPAKNARFVLLIAIDEPAWGYVPGVGKNQMGGVCAAPAFREIGRRTLEYLGVTPDDPFSLPGKDHDKADFAREVKELKALYEAWNHSK
ncbi:MAG TPA: penicillin-binding protein 2 [Rhabdochlamydiaceae bacterium]|nr:penicillin-binding protein 2 [Rhabdochlamydiaceae bacterium]